jgi:DNA modification methylase
VIRITIPAVGAEADRDRGGLHRVSIPNKPGENSLVCRPVLEKAIKSSSGACPRPRQNPDRRLASVADAIKDVSKRGGIVLDLFGGSGSSLIAADKAGRRGRLCELDPAAPERLASRRRRSQVPR